MKRIRAALALLLAALLLAGCSAGKAVSPIGAAAPKGHREDSALWAARAERPVREDPDPVPFEEMVYVRPDLDQLRQEAAEAERVITAGTDAEAAAKLFAACQDAFVHYDTMTSLALIRSRQDVTDSAMAEEYAWCQANSGEVLQAVGRVYDLWYASPFAGFADWEETGISGGEAAGIVSYSDAAVALLAQENDLVSRYRTLAAQLSAATEGGYLEDWDQAYSQYNGEFARLYLQLAAVRQALAAELGYSSYEQMAYAYDYYRDYSPEQAMTYCEEIRAYMSPLFRQLWEGDPYGETSFSPLEEERLHLLLGAAAQEMGGQIAEAYGYMDRYGLYDVRRDDRKASGSFQIYLTAYEAPFVFLDAAGDIGDLPDYAHEFGHFVDGYVNCNAPASLDLSECFSQSMEFLTLSALRDSLSGEELDALWRIQLLDTAQLYVEQAAFAAFEHTVYAQADPERLDAGYLNSLCLELMEEFGLQSEEGDSLYNSMCWMGISHLFESPFYVISYPVSADCAMQLLQAELEEPGQGVEKYQDLLPRQAEGLLDSLSCCGLESPYAPGRVEQAADLLYSLLEQTEAALPAAG